MSADGVFSGDVAALAFGPTEQSTAETADRGAQPAAGRGARRRGHRPRTSSAGCSGGTATDGRRRRAATAVSTGRRASVSIQSGGTIRVDRRVGRARPDAPGPLRPARHRGRRPARTSRPRSTGSPTTSRSPTSRACSRPTPRSALAGGGAGPEVTLVSTAPELVRSVQLLLSDLGIASRIAGRARAVRRGRRRRGPPAPRLRRGRPRFLALVGTPLSPDKQARGATRSSPTRSPAGSATRAPRPSPRSSRTASRPSTT